MEILPFRGGSWDTYQGGLGCGGKGAWKNWVPRVGVMGAGSGAASGADIADTLGETFCHNSSSFNCSESFRGLKESWGGLS